MAQTKKHAASPLILLVLFLISFSLVSVVSANTEDAKKAFNEGLEYDKVGNTMGATTSYKACIGADPEYIDAYINLGTIYFSQKDYEKALDMFKTATEKDKSNVDAFSNLGKVEYKLKKYAEAEASFKAAIALAPSAGLYKELGKVYYKKKNYKEVIDTFSKCHEQNGGDYMTYYMLGKGYQKTGNTSQAVITLKESTKIKSNYNAYSTIGQIYLSEEKYKSAASAFRSALKADPKKYRAAYNYAIAVESNDPENYAVNIKNWETFIKVGKKNPKANKDIAVAKQHVKDLKDAQEKSDLQ